MTAQPALTATVVAMSLDELLAALRRCAKEIQQQERASEVAMTIATLFHELDRRLTSGAFLPQEWE